MLRRNSQVGLVGRLQLLRQLQLLRRRRPQPRSRRLAQEDLAPLVMFHLWEALKVQADLVLLVMFHLWEALKVQADQALLVMFHL